MNSLTIAGNLPGAAPVLMRLMRAELLAGDGMISIVALMRIAHACDLALHGAEHSRVRISMR